MGFPQHSQYCRRVDRDRDDGPRGFKDEVLGEELHLLQAGNGGGGGGGARAGVECVRLRAVCHSVLLQLQVTSQGVDVMDDLVTRRHVTLTAEDRNETK